MLRTVRTALRAREAFLAALAEGASVTRSCQVARLPRQTAYDWRESDAEFRAAWDAAIELGTDALEDEAVRRGKEGVLRPVYQGGKLVGHVREYSDQMLITMLKARRPDKFKDRTAVEHSGGIDLAGRLRAGRERRERARATG